MAPGAAAEITAPSPGGPDETIQQAYSIQPGVTYSGAFDNTSYTDADYLQFNVASAGETLTFTVTNTTEPCNDPDQADCPVYATLMDSTNNQVGGDNSAAGTIATYRDSETFSWTFAQPGTYFLLMESNGDEAVGSPAYAVQYTQSGGGSGGSGGSGSGSGGSGGGSGGSGSGSGGSGGTGGSSGGSPGSAPGPSTPLVKSITVAQRQHGDVVRGSLVLARKARRLGIMLFSGHPARGRPIAGAFRLHVAAGRHRFALRLPARYRRYLARHHQLSLTVEIVITSASGVRHAFRREVTMVAAGP